MRIEVVFLAGVRNCILYVARAFNMKYAATAVLMPVRASIPIVAKGTFVDEAVWACG